MRKCKSNKGGITEMYIINSADCVFNESGNFVRLKRKYGEYKRPVVELKKPKLKNE